MFCQAEICQLILTEGGNSENLGTSGSVLEICFMTFDQLISGQSKWQYEQATIHGHLNRTSI
jgi:hypothetical protein